jgi:cytochrome c556
MIRTALVALGLAIGVSAVVAQSNPIAERKDAMKSVGAATREGAAMAKGEAPFDAAKVKGIFKVYSDAAKKVPALVPDNSKTGGETTAAPKVWEDQAGFKTAFAKFEADAAKGAASATDLASFRAAFGDATKNCGSCHEAYRIKK